MTETESPSISTPVSKSPNNPGPPPHSPPPGYRWQLEWRLVKDSGSLDSGSLNSVSTVTNSKSFEEIILDKIKPHDAKPKPKRSKVDLMAKLVTHEEYLAALKAKEEPKKKKPKQANISIDSDDLLPDDDVESIAGSSSSDSSSEEEDSSEITTFPATERQAITFLKKL